MRLREIDSPAHDGIRNQIHPSQDPQTKKAPAQGRGLRGRHWDGGGTGSVAGILRIAQVGQHLRGNTQGARIVRVRI
jgi:hypothetical protein